MCVEGNGSDELDSQYEVEEKREKRAEESERRPLSLAWSAS